MAVGFLRMPSSAVIPGLVQGAADQGVLGDPVEDPLLVQGLAQVHVLSDLDAAEVDEVHRTGAHEGLVDLVRGLFLGVEADHFLAPLRRAPRKARPEDRGSSWRRW
jgi:hypothetical protein